ncbi:hypothetical protein [Parasphingorhabdus sp.]|uniref:hypothetical protein n=1 Tax=Parasphingorhabdus sp. TaxID=2709688 RepID=UPI0030A88585|nr:hypothetical protein [Sphingomonadales bacterium]
MTKMTRFSAFVTSTALVFTGFSPAMAAPMHSGIAIATPIDVAALGWTADSGTAKGWGDYRRDRGYRGHRRHRDGISGGDLLAGILVIGGIAAIASAASKNSRDRRYEDRDYRSENQRDDGRRADLRDDSRYGRGSGDMESAINACSDAAERQAGRDARVSAIESVVRDGDGWRVEGELSNSEQGSFLCGASEGRVDFVQLENDDLAFAN